MHAEAPTLAERLRAYEVAPERLRSLALATALSLYAIIVTGALVRLTASGLGCESWPGCDERSFFPASNQHGLIEFGNRVFGVIPITLSVVTAFAARRAPALPRWAVLVALGVAVATVIQAPLGLLTITSGLHPLLVMSHFLLALVALAGATVFALESAGHARGRLASAAPREIRRLGLVVTGACFALLVTGAFVTASGPHPGDRADIRRLGTLEGTVYVHAALTATFGCALLLALGYLAARRRELSLQFRAGVALVALVLVQIAIGEIQWRAALPWGLVLVHVAVAAAVWVATVVFAALLWAAPVSAQGTRA